jgi:Ceramidase
MPTKLNTRFKFSSFVLTLSMAVTMLSIWRPYVNAFAQMSLVFPVTYYFVTELRKIKDTEPDVHNFGFRTMGIMAVAVFLWFNDRIFCDFYRSVNVTYLHAIWHLLSYIASSSACTLGLYLYMKLDRPKIRCEIAYWPRSDFKLLGIPYVKLKEHKS